MLTLACSVFSKPARYRDCNLYDTILILYWCHEIFVQWRSLFVFLYFRRRMICRFRFCLHITCMCLSFFFLDASMATWYWVCRFIPSLYSILLWWSAFFDPIALVSTLLTLQFQVPFTTYVCDPYLSFNTSSDRQSYVRFFSMLLL